ncbi:MAG: hypothetical protein MJY56_01600, partial [Bacteroidales bacterium]|nr:hypothetical protein [Bacteroidales bacterium]
MTYMRHDRRHILVSIFIISLLLHNAGPAFSQESSYHFQLDSTVTQYPDGSVHVEYVARPFDFGLTSRPTTSKPKSLAPSECEKIAFFESNRAEHEAKVSSLWDSLQVDLIPEFEEYAVGEIPIHEGVTPTGARTYQIPITTASEYKFIPSVSLAYNSQAGEGWAGYGWDIQGLSSIILVNKNMYYHGTAKGANVNDTDAVFALDGVPIVRNTILFSLYPSFPLITASGNILVCPNYNDLGYVDSFTVKYPNGTTAQFGNGTGADYDMPSYPITEITDLEGRKIIFEYYSDSDNGIGRLSTIRYGFDQSGQYHAEISFSYTANTVFTTRYYAGRSVYRDYRLVGVSSKNNETTLCQYNLDYVQNDNVWLLSQVNCSSDGVSLRPLKFEYGSVENHYQPNNGYLYQDIDHFIYLNEAFTSNDEDCDFICRRGKFVAGSFNDGILCYPDYDNYGVKNPNGIFYQFGSLYPDNQAILFAPEITQSATPSCSITAGSGFQTIEAVDVDGDGLDELVKVNFNGTSGDNTKLLITIYKCDTFGIPVQDSLFEVLVHGTITSGNHVSPYRREYFWGDFLGNGKIQLLSVAFDKNYNSRRLFDQTSYATLIDLSTHAVLCDSELFDYTLVNSKSLIVCDIDNDSKTELCYATSSGLDVYRLQESSSFVKENTYDEITSSILSSTTRPSYITDINGDGYIEIMVSPTQRGGNVWSRYAFDGVSFRHSTVYLTHRSLIDTFMFIDINNDGLSDLVKISGTTFGTCINRDGSTFNSFTLSPSTITDAKGVIPCNVVDYSGASCFIKIDGHYIREYKYSLQSNEIRCLTLSVDSMGRRIFNDYNYLPSCSRYLTDSTFTVNNSSGYAFRALPLNVLEYEEAYLDNSPNARRYRYKNYNYFNGVVHSLGLGFCGFSKIRTTDYLAGDGDARNIVEEIHDPQKMGVVTSITSRHGSIQSDPYYTITNTYDDHSTPYGKLNPRLTSRVENDILTGIETTTTYSYNSFDLPHTTQTSRRIGTGPAQTEKITRKYENSTTTSKYVLGAPSEEYSIKEGDGCTDLGWKEKYVNTYDSCYRLLTRKHYVGQYGTVYISPILRPIFGSPTILSDPAISSPLDSLELIGSLEEVIPFEPLEPIDTTILHPYEPIGDPVYFDATNLVSETKWQYDTLGNVISEKSSLYGSTEFVGTTYTYDSNGRYLLTKTDELGHTTSFGGYSKFGKPTTATDYRNRTTSYSYDSWGNLVSTTNPDGTIEQRTPSWGGTGLYIVATAITGKPETVIHYDALGREIRNGVKRFDGQWQWVDNEYDLYGRLSRTSLPYRGQAATYWSTYTYDAYGRPVSLTEGSGKTSTWSYDGTSVTTVKDGMTSIKTTDANGNVVSVTDAGGTITYTLRDDGQPSKVSAPGNVETVFTYDNFGRRTKMVDPSAGTQTDSYTWNTDGTSITSHTNPNGTIKTYRDKYGRVTLVERPNEYNTAYTYNTYGLLSTEQSTNGTRVECTYDSLDRIITAKETVPDGKWLQMAYTYGAGSVISAAIVYGDGVAEIP